MSKTKKMNKRKLKKITSIISVIILVIIGYFAAPIINEAENLYNSIDDIEKEEKVTFSTSDTIENIDFSKAVIDENGFSYNTAVVTDIFHEYRASKLVKKAGLEFGSVPADCVWYLFPTFYVREVIAVTASFVGLA